MHSIQNHFLALIQFESDANCSIVIVQCLVHCRESQKSTRIFIELEPERAVEMPRSGILGGNLGGHGRLGERKLSPYILYNVCRKNYIKFCNVRETFAISGARRLGMSLQKCSENL